MNRLIFIKNDSFVQSFLIENDIPVSIGLSSYNESLLGNVYVGRVTNIVSNIGAAFIDIADGISCYLSLEENKNPFFLNKKNVDKFCIGDLILVQVKREKIKSKRPMVSCNIELAGEYCVVMHGKHGINVSSKINNQEKRNELLNILKEFSSEEFALIARTNSKNADSESIKKDIKYLIGKMSDIYEKSKFIKAGSCVYQSPKNYLSELSNIYTDNIDEIVVQDNDLYEEINDYVEHNASGLLGKVRLYTDEYGIDKLYGTEKIMENATRKSVWLKSGASIVIEPTEALTSIDVNTGKAIYGKKSAQETFYKINMEAALEIARQIRLRNLSGIIIIDFIDMMDNDKKQKLIDYFESLIRLDPIKTVYVDMTGLNLVEVTRKKIKPPLHEIIKDLNLNIQRRN